MSKELDIVVFGATGFTGSLVVEYFAHKIAKGDKESKELRWAIAGRDETKLHKVRATAAKIAPDLEKLSYIVIDSSDQKALTNLCARTKVILTTVGPYTKYGEPLVEACAKTGTHYCDITGETHWIRKMVDKYHELAKSNGSRIVHCAGFDSEPSDLGALYVANHLYTEKKTKVRSVKANFVLKNLKPSGGSLATAMEIVSLPREELRKALAPYCLNTSVSQENLKGKTRPEEKDIKWIYRDPDFGLVKPFIMAATNTRIVRRSASLVHESVPEKKNPFSPNFSYNETTQATNYIFAALFCIFLVLGLRLLRIGFVRKFVAKHLLSQPGTGPSAEERAKASFRGDFVGVGEDGTKVRALISGGDPGYTDTAKMVAETALTLAFDADSAPNITGVVTPATACGLPLISRLQASGIVFQIVDSK